MATTERPSILCLQETKLNVISEFDIMQLLGVGFDYTYLPSVQTHGGILVTWKASSWSVASSFTKRFSVTRVRGPDWWLTSVYGPVADAEKLEFLDELRSVGGSIQGPWLVTGDFNMIYRAQDKSNDRLDRRLMGQFWHFLNDMALKELHLSGQLYTWSNECIHPMLDHINCAFVSKEWDDIFPRSDLLALPTICSKHAPLILRTDAEFQNRKQFLFWSFWTHCDKFLEVMERACNAL
jgi:exonuclease III